LQYPLSIILQRAIIKERCTKPVGYKMIFAKQFFNRNISDDPNLIIFKYRLISIY